MIPREPSRGPQLGFLYIPPYRIQGISIAGEQSFVQVPELDVCFDIGTAPRTALTSNYVALTHGHMDHAAGIAYYFSQRQFQGMGTGNIFCPPEVKPAIQNIMEAWSGLEGQRTPFNVIPLGHEQEFQIKNGIDLRAFTTQHTVPSVGYVVVEKRSKLLPELQGMEQEQIMAIKASGRPITHVLQIPLVCYTGDTYWGSHFQRDDVLKARILITECPFLEPSPRKRAAVGKHLHVDNILDLCEASEAEAIVLTHLSRRTHLGEARKLLERVIPARHRDRLHILMDSRANKRRYERQLEEAAAPGSAAENA